MKKISLIAILVLSIQAIQLRADQASEEWITIFIHGTVGLRANLNPGNFFKILRDRVKNSSYADNVNRIREAKYLYTMQPIQRLGLHPIAEDCASPCGPYAFSLLYDQVNRDYYPHQINTYYTFGWSGLLSFIERKEQSLKLYKELKELLASLEKQGSRPKVRIVAYSHGGNLTMNLATVRNCHYPEDTFCIDEAIVVGMPIQQASIRVINDPIFKMIYNISSDGDAVQRLDIFSPCNVFSHKRFKGCMPDNVKQVKIKVTAELLPVPKKTLPINMRGTINQSPGHIELWFFGWTHKAYRRNFVFYPLPMSVFIPYLTYIVEQHDRPMNILTVDFRPDQGIVCLKEKPHNCSFVMPLMPQERIDALIAKARTFDPRQPKYREKYISSIREVDAQEFRVV